MDRIFVEQEIEGTLRIAAIDKHRIFNAQNPGDLATVFECSSTDPTPEDCAEIFYALAPSIGADDIFVDIKEHRRSCKLNVWSIGIKDRDINNLFMAVTPLNHDDRIKLYTTKYSITPDNTITSNSISLFSLVAFSDTQSWKTGILQRCFDSLVLPKFRNNPSVYSLCDEQYRKIMRFKYETETETMGTPSIVNGILISFIRRITEMIELKHSRDTTIFFEIPNEIDPYLKFFEKDIPPHLLKESLQDRLSNVLSLWVGSTVMKCENGYRLELDCDVTEALGYMAPLLIKPKQLAILETPM